MAYLVLDLDEMMIVTENRYFKVHPDHSLSNFFWIEWNKHSSVNPFEAFYAQVINPRELADLITYAYQSGHEIIILTSGCYDESIKTSIADNLHLDANLKEKFKACHFFSPVKEFDLSIHKDLTTIAAIQNLVKSIRLERIAQHLGLLSSYTYFVLLDDNSFHVDACKAFKSSAIGMTGVLAETQNESKDFYNLAKAMLSMFEKVESVTRGFSPESHPATEEFLQLDSSPEPPKLR
jgi:hypothetical protein